MTQKVLNVALLGQDTGEWCWAACSSMIMAYHEVQKKQCDMASYCFGGSCCDDPTPASCISANCYTTAEWEEDNYADLIGIVDNLTHWGFSCTNNEGVTPAFADVKAQIDTNNPFLFTWDWTGGGGHAMVVKGYLEQMATVNDSSLNVQLICINDPWGDTNAEPHKGDTSWLPYELWTTHAQVSSNLEAQAESENTAVGVSSHENSFLWDAGRPDNFIGHTFGGYVGDIIKATTSSGAAATGKASEAGSSTTGGGIQHASADQLAKSLLAIVPELTRAADPELEIADDADLSLGVPHPVIHLRHDRLQAHEVSNDITALFSHVNEIIYPVYFRGEVVSAIVLVRQGAGWTMKRIGQRNLVTLLTTTREQHLSDNDGDVSNYFVLHLPHNYRIFVAYREGGQIQIIHAQEHEGYGFKRGATQTLDEVIAAMLPNIKATDRPPGKVG